MGQIIRIGVDTSKQILQLHGVDAAERPMLRRKLSRGQMVKFFERLPPAVVALEACGASHHWARVLPALGHEARLIAPQLAKPYVRRGKNDPPPKLKRATMNSSTACQWSREPEQMACGKAGTVHISSDGARVSPTITFPRTPKLPPPDTLEILMLPHILLPLR